MPLPHADIIHDAMMSRTGLEGTWERGPPLETPCSHRGSNPAPCPFLSLWVPQRLLADLPAPVLVFPIRPTVFHVVKAGECPTSAQDLLENASFLTLLRISTAQGTAPLFQGNDTVEFGVQRVGQGPRCPLYRVFVHP